MELFEFVRAAADRLAPRERISDADLGRMIGLESARTSRWKHGRISISDAPRLLALSASLGIDISILSNVAAGYLTARDAELLVSSEKDFVRFLGEQIMPPLDGQSLTLISSDGSEARVVRRTATKYERPFKRGSSSRRLSEERREIQVVLADDDPVAAEVFSNLTGKGTDIEGLVARSIPEMLIMAGRLHPRLVIVDLFLGQADGFAAVRALTSSEDTSATEVVATSAVVNPDITRTALGSGASDLLARPLRARPLGRLLRDLRRSS